MSYDFNVIEAACDHFQTAERYVINEDDMRTLQLAANPSVALRAPVNGVNFVKLYISGRKIEPSHLQYGYQILRDSNRLESADVFYKIVFNQPVRLIRLLIEVSYPTKQSFCLKCNATGKLNDFKKAASGGFIRVLNTDKLVQRSLKFILTSTCEFYPSYTSQLKNFIGRKFGFSITENDINQEVIQALERLKRVQFAQKQVQSVTPSELLRDVVSVKAQLDTANPTLVRLAATVSSYGTEVSPLNFTLRANK